MFVCKESQKRNASEQDVKAFNVTLPQLNEELIRDAPFSQVTRWENSFNGHSRTNVMKSAERPVHVKNKSVKYLWIGMSDTTFFFFLDYCGVFFFKISHSFLLVMTQWRWSRFEDIL